MTIKVSSLLALLLETEHEIHRMNVLGEETPMRQGQKSRTPHQAQPRPTNAALATVRPADVARVTPTGVMSKKFVEPTPNEPSTTGEGDYLDVDMN